jgi:hypothetical protein
LEGLDIMRIVQSSDFPDDTTTDDVNRANSTLDYVHSRLVPTLPISASNPAYQAADLVTCYIQTILRRSLQLFEGAIYENRQNRRLTSIVCVRAFWETAAAFMDFASELEEHLASPNKVATRQWIANQLMRTRLPEFTNENTKAKNILTQIDKLAKKYSLARELYDYLSDHSHPNVAGTFGFFGAFEDDFARFNDVSEKKDIRDLLRATELVFEYLAAEITGVEDKLSAWRSEGST